MNSLITHKIKYKEAINWAFILLMLGTAYQHFFWNTPYLGFFWSEDLLSPIIRLFHINWDSIVSNPFTEVISEWISMVFGATFLLSSLIVFSKQKTKWATFLVQLGCVLYFIYLIIDWETDSFNLPHLLEKSARFATVWLVFIAHKEISEARTLLIIKTSIALTFTFHGLFALNFFPLPGSFIDMTILILKVDESSARMFLAVVGVLDILFSFGLFIRKTERAAFIYMVIWGLLTALARIVAHFSFDAPFVQLHRWTFECLIRAPHFLLPLAGIIMRFQLVKPINGSNTIR